MKNEKSKFYPGSLFVLGTINLYSQNFKLDKKNLEPVNASMSLEKLMGKDVVKVIMDSSVKASDQPTFVKLRGPGFKNGTIELKVPSRLPNMSLMQIWG